MTLPGQDKGDPPYGSFAYADYVHVNYVFLDKILNQESYEVLLSKLPTQEQQEGSRFKRLEDRLSFAATRILVRQMLSGFGAEPEAGWRFKRSTLGKPALVRDPGAPDLRFNVSHSAGAIAAAVSVERELGIDIESRNPRIDCLEIARSEFAEIEFSRIQALPQKEQTDAFFTLWTVKEAYAKMRGSGLSSPLSQLALDLHSSVIPFSPKQARRAKDWVVWQQLLRGSYFLAVAAERRAGECFTFRIREVAAEALFTPGLCGGDGAKGWLNP